MSNKKEVVVCAAIKVAKYGNNGNYLVRVFMGCYYESIVSSPDYVRDFNTGAVAYTLEGFITNQDRFVTPQEALLITGRQNEMRFQNRKYLLPEDFY